MEYKMQMMQMQSNVVFPCLMVLFLHLHFQNLYPDFIGPMDQYPSQDWCELFKCRKGLSWQAYMHKPTSYMTICSKLTFNAVLEVFTFYSTSLLATRHIILEHIMFQAYSCSSSSNCVLDTSSIVIRATLRKCGCLKNVVLSNVLRRTNTTSIQANKLYMSDSFGWHALKMFRTSQNPTVLLEHWLILE